jgi:hypothetical protein
VTTVTFDVSGEIQTAKGSHRERALKLEAANGWDKSFIKTRQANYD